MSTETKELTKEEIDIEFRSIISHALLGSDTSDVDKETWDLVFSECTNFMVKELAEKDRVIAELNLALNEAEKKIKQLDTKPY